MTWRRLSTAWRFLLQMQWLTAGVQPGDSATLARKIIQANAGAALLIATILFYNLGFAWVGHPVLVHSAVVQLPNAVLAVGVWWLNHRRFLGTARVMVMLLAMSDVLVTCYSGQGTLLNPQIFCLMFAMLMPTLFPVEQWRITWVLIVANLALYVVLEHSDVPVDPSLYSLPVAMRRALVLGNTLSCGVVMLIMATLTERAAARNERTLQALASTDVLTGLANRRQFENLLLAEVSRLSRAGGVLSLAVLDVDHFKQVNDTFGHSGGDQALVHVAQIVQAQLRSHDTLARIGGEEFAVLLPETDLRAACAVAERFRAALARQGFALNGKERTVTISVGVVDIHPGSDPDRGLQRADEALYRAKAEGRNRVCLAEPDPPAVL
jgi:diguanylate cyclase (GGDEF)-like protein